MSSNGSFHDKSYRQHAEHFKEYIAGGDKEEHAKAWFLDDTVDAWRHQRMYQVIDPILVHDPDARWLTVGDGRAGNDARYIQGKGCNALASDISESLLKEAKELGYIPDYNTENAEALSFEDAAFDYVLCKESYHHFPRPMVALYEMLRVCGKGVLLIEPNDVHINQSVLNSLVRYLKSAIKLLLRRSLSKHTFEESGNYVYSISRREIEKVALGLNYKMVAFKGINDAYFTGVEYEKLADKGPLQRKTRALIGLLDLLCGLRLIDHGLLAVLVLKAEPTAELIQRLDKAGYKVVLLPENPYISD
jgi:ubiquinone/menaquinone biosynthesis C-methylase UbiE